MTAAALGEAKVEHRRVEESVASLPPHQRRECQGWVVIKRGRVPLTARLLHTGCSRRHSGGRILQPLPVILYSSDSVRISRRFPYSRPGSVRIPDHVVSIFAGSLRVSAFQPTWCPYSQVVSVCSDSVRIRK